MKEKAPQPMPTNTEIISLATIRIGVQREVMDNTKEQAEKVLATHTRTQFAEILKVFAMNGLILPELINVSSFEDPSLYIWYKVNYLPKDNSLILTEQKLGEEETVVVENRPYEWINYAPKVVEEFEKIEANRIQQDIKNTLADFKRCGIELPDHLNYVELESSTDNQKKEIYRVKHLGESNRLVTTKQSISPDGNSIGEETIIKIFHPDLFPRKWIEYEPKIIQKYYENAQEVERNKSSSK